MLFTIRVELHNAGYSDYLQLHGAMENEGLSRTIKGNDGLWYQLPMGTYNLEGHFAIGNVKAGVIKAANTVGKKYSILVTAGTHRDWENLKLA